MKRLSPLWMTFWIAVGLSVLATLSILLLNPILRQVELLPDQGAAWYYWKLPEPSFWTRCHGLGLLSGASGVLLGVDPLGG